MLIKLKFNIMLIKLKFNIDIEVYYRTVKTALFLKSFKVYYSFCFISISNVYKFIYSYDTDITYIDMTTCHMDTRAKEHLHSKNTKSAIHDHIKVCKTCLKTEYDINSSQILRKCSSKYETKIHETLLI